MKINFVKSKKVRSVWKPWDPKSLSLLKFKMINCLKSNKDENVHRYEVRGKKVKLLVKRERESKRKKGKEREDYPFQYLA